ncbi:MAG TPA: enoyl-CoA hydratase-related protein [Macromonas sp.]|nr:enoyl-CoA hydratase-related protein [Macromonas sp.]
MSYSSIQLTVTDGLARVVLDQAALGNPFNEAFCNDWVALANELTSRDDVRAVLITANGRFFSVGGDIAMFQNNLDELPKLIKKWTATLHMGIARMARLNAPIVTAVHASAMGGAVALVASSDVVFAARSAVLGSAYAGIGYCCDAGASIALSQRMGVARARRYLLLAENLKAEQAQDAGLVDFVCDDADVAAQAEALAKRLAHGPTRAYGAIRTLFKTALSQGLEAQLEDEAQSLSRIAGTADAREGIVAFVEKRKPQFRGQ